MKKILTLCFLMALVCAKGWGQVATATWPLTSNANATVAGGINALPFSRGSGLNFTGFTSSGASSNGFSSIIINTSKYYQFAVTPTSTNSFHVSTFSFDARATNNTGSFLGFLFNLTLNYEVDYLISSTGTGTDNDFYFNSNGSTTGSISGNGSISLNIAVDDNIAEGSTVYFRIYPYGGRNDNTTKFFTKNAVINGNTFIAPANDLCSNATPLVVGTPSTGTTVNATLSNSSFFYSSDVWYKFTACGTGTNTTSVSLTTSNQDLDIFIFDGGCPTNTGTYFKSGIGSSTTSETSSNFSITAGHTYLVRVAKSSGTSGNFTINLNSTTIAPPTFILTSGVGSNIQTICSGSPITPIKYTVGNSTTTPTVTGLPSGVTGSLSGSVFTISGAPTVSGTFNYTVSTSNSCALATATGKITVNPAPTASVSAASPSACAGSSVAVTFSGTPGETITYTVGSASSSVTINAAGDAQTVNTPANQGSYTYTITGVTLPGSTCPAVITGSPVTVTINALPAVAAISGPDYIAVGATGNFSDATSGGVWSIDNTAYATLNNPAANPVTVSGVSVGVPTLTYTFTNANGCSNSVSKSIQVFDNTITLYRTVDSGIATNPAIWEVLGPNGFTPATTAPNNSNNILIRHNVTLQNADYNGAAGTSLAITSHEENGITVPGSLIIAPNHSFATAGGADFGGNSVTLQSNINSTASIGQITGSLSGATNVTAERFIAGRRAWRFLSVAVVSGQTINEAWQEGAVPNPDIHTRNNPRPGYGTQITYDNNTAHGFDVNRTTAPSLKTWLAASRSWTTSAPFTNTTNINAYGAYCIFIRGSRAVDVSLGTSAPADNTILRATGTLRVGGYTQDYVTTAGNSVLIGNPYASTIDILSVINNNAGAFTADKFRVWDPAIAGKYGVGGYITYTNGIFAPTAPATQVSYSGGTFAQSGQAFMLEATTTGNTPVAFAESDKAAAQANVFGRMAQGQPQKAAYPAVYTNLMAQEDNHLSLIDGVAAGFAGRFSAKVDAGDAGKLLNFNENIMLVRDSQSLAIELRPLPAGNDTLYYKLLYLEARPYVLQIFTGRVRENMPVRGWLTDKYLGTQTEVNLNDTTLYHFTAGSDTASYRSRFMLVFSRSAKAGVIASLSGSAQAGSLLPAAVQVYPNPVRGGRVTLRYGGLAAGSYGVSVYSRAGQPLYQKQITAGKDGAAQSETLRLGSSLPQGSYTLTLTDSSGRVVFSDKLVVAR